MGTRLRKIADCHALQWKDWQWQKRTARNKRVKSLSSVAAHGKQNKIEELGNCL
jgi:hypothetical protein